jgi:hypothetical protein
MANLMFKKRVTLSQVLRHVRTYHVEQRRVVVTGMGAITPLGSTVDSFWNGLTQSSKLKHDHTNH